MNKLTRRTEQIADHPYSGRSVPEYEIDDIRELIEKPNRVNYRIRQEQIDVLAVIRGSKLLPEEIL